MIRVSELEKIFGARTLFRDVNLEFVSPNRYGLVGANGSGKSTFAKILCGDEPTSAGSVVIPKRVQVGVLRQDRFESDEQRILDVVLMGHAEVYEAIQSRERLLAKSDASVAEAEAFADIEEVMSRHDGYTLEARAAEILEGLGIPAAQHPLPLGTLSGGFKLRVLLAQTLAARPDILVLDEPTNHLDILSIHWLEQFLREYPGCVVLISHDRRFLNTTCTHIVDVDYETMQTYVGNYDDFERQKQEERARKQSEIDKRERKISEHQEFIDRFRAKATKARQAQSRVKQMERIVIEKLPDSSRRYPVFRFVSQRPSGREVLKVDSLSKSYGKRSVLRDVSFLLRRGERVAILGANGVGKSTLLKTVAGVLSPDSGSSEWGHETHIGYFAQDHREIVSGAGTVESWLWEKLPEEGKGSIRSRLGAVLFSGDDAEKKLTALSGGEAARLIFARMAAESPNVLLLDEPTNHLDIEAIEALKDALLDYDGTLLFVSHDRWFVSVLANRIIEITPDGIFDYAGSYAEFVTHRGEDHLQTNVNKSRPSASVTMAEEEKSAPKNSALYRQEKKARDREIRRMEKRRDEVTAQIDAAESELSALQSRFCEPDFYSSTEPAMVVSLQEKQTALESNIAAWMEEWENIESKIESEREAGA